ncbi:MAG: hypothetical protein DHS20C15_15550 [Planctomycetota bacterium]|nr:MAG: hypothetical protein DHS20C15_15550 [Planctomycetota bacterium]
MLGHLDAEARLAEPPITLRAAAVERLSAAAGVLRALALPGDSLWTPQPLDPRALPAIEWLPAPRVISGALPSAGAVIPWATVPGMTDPGMTVAREVGSSAWSEPASQVPHDGTSSPLQPTRAEGLPLVDALRRAPRPPLDVQRLVSHRGFASELAARFDVGLSGAAWLANPEALRVHLDSFERAPAQWVLKAPLSAAGEGLSVQRPERPLDPAHIARAFARRGELLFEPWETRAADFGLCAWIDAAGLTQIAGLHQLVSDAAGGFRGVVAPALNGSLPALSAAHEAQLRATGERVGAALAAVGHRGPFGIDAYLRAGAAEPASGGSSRLRCLVEINARLSFGHLVHALAERARKAGVVSDQQGLALRLGSPRSTPPSAACALVQPVEGRGLWAWIEPQDLT